MKNFTQKVSAVLFGMMMLASSADAQIVISKVFYAGKKKVADGKNYTGAPEYIELHNNTDKEVDIAGYCIGLVESEATTGAYLAKDREKGYEVKLKQVFQIPGESYMVAPWGNVVIAANAIDHSQEAVGGQDLSKADFEFGGQKTDNENVPNLDLLFSFNASTKALNLTNGGDASILLIKKNNVSKLTYADESTFVFANGKTTGSKYLPFNAYYAMDAVEILKVKKNSETNKYEVDATRKRFSDSQDSCYVMIPGDVSMLRDGNVVYRKTALAFDGKYYLLDSGNSATDFAVSNTIGVNEYSDEVSCVTETVKVTIPESGFLPFNAKKYFFTDKGLYLGYVSISSGKATCNSKAGNETIALNSTFLLIGKPGEYTISYTDAPRNLATSGANSWISDNETKYADGVLTITTKNRFPMKFVNEKGNARFVQDPVDDNKQKLKIDVATEGRYYINHTVDNVAELKWDGIMPEDISTAISSVVINTPAADYVIYNLQGTRMNSASLPSGIYIQGGKKFVVK